MSHDHIWSQVADMLLSMILNKITQVGGLNVCREILYSCSGPHLYSAAAA